MATPVTSPKTTSSPPTAGAGVELHPSRPLKYSWSLLKGGVSGVLNGMANFGRNGFFAGAGVGLLVGIASTGAILGTMALGAAIGMGVGAAAGAVIGTLSGAYKEVSLAQRRDKYSDEVNERQRARTARDAEQPPVVQTGPSWVERSGVQNRVANYNFERAQQQERENNQDFNRYWQDLEDNRARHHNIWR